MKLYIFTFLVAVVVISECHHTFLGTNVLRPMVYRYSAQYNAVAFKKRVENLSFTMPSSPANFGRVLPIQGILAVDLTNSGATANVTRGGLGYSFVNIRVMSDRGTNINYDIYIYA